MPGNCKATTEFSDGLAAVAILPDGITIKTERWFGPMPSNREVARKCLWGFVDQTGTMVIKPKFRIGMRTAGNIVVPKFSNGLCPVGIDTSKKGTVEYGYINKSGEFAIKPQYKFADKFSDGLARVKVGPLHFVPQDWKAAIHAKSTWDRQHMLEALGKDYELIGMNRKQALEVLGPPDEKANVGLDWFYLLGKGGCGSGGIWFEIRFSNNKITSYRFADLQKQGAWLMAPGAFPDMAEAND